MNRLTAHNHEEHPLIRAVTEGLLGRIVALAMSCLVLLAFYFGGLYIEPGPVTYALALVPISILIITAIARVNDLGISNVSLRCSVRRLGLVLAGLGAGFALASPLVTGGEISWREVTILWGFALAWLTSPHMPPWQAYVSKYGLLDHSEVRREP